MTQIKLVGGFYQAKSLIADAQRCLNLFPEPNPEDAPFPFTHYLTPGLRRLSTPFGGPGQGLYVAYNGDLYAAAGGGLYYVNSSYTPSRIGTLNSQNRVYMADNATAGSMIVVDGTSSGLLVNTALHTASLITDPNFYGGTRIAFVDGYFVITKPDTNEIYLSNQYSIIFNPLYFAGKTGGGDPVVSCIALHRELWLLGSETTEVWYNTGATDFPYQPIIGVFIQHGVAAINSVAQQDLSVYWLGQNPQGRGIVFRGNGYQAKRISTFAIEAKIQSYGKIDDAIGFIYQQDGHVFYVLTFPSADKTWVFDESTQFWHERALMDQQGLLHRIAPVAQAQAYGEVIMQDAQDGSLYAYDTNQGYDDVAYASNITLRARSFPHLINDGRRLLYSRFIADLQTGNVVNTMNVPGDTGDMVDGQPQMTMRFSDNRGATWSTPLTQTFGCTGQENTQIIFTRLGMAKDRIFEVSWTTGNITALNGGFIEVTPATT